jgi:hypothetical protein
MKGRGLRRSVAAPAPIFVAKAKRIEAFLVAVCDMKVRNMSLLELREIADFDRQLAIKVPPASLSARDRVLQAIRNGATCSVDVAEFTGIPPKEASAWLSVLCAKGEIEKIAEMQLDRPGRKTYAYREVPA